MLKKFILIVLTCALSSAVVCGLFGLWGYYFLTRDLPKLSRIEDYKPAAVTRVLSSEGNLIAEFYSERRYPVKLAEVPTLIRNAFLAAEDSSFYSHPGIDLISILRAAVKNMQRGGVKQGASTITQQVVKNLLLSSEKSLIRKAKEAILSYRLEKRFSKDEIFEIYLNQIFFGNSAYGIKSAARLYYHKELPEVTLAEAAFLAGLPKAPSSYSPLKNFKLAKQRQEQVLRQMRAARFITDEQQEEASKEQVTFYPASQKNVFASPYYVGELRRVFAEKWKDLDLDSDGLEITTAVDAHADLLAMKALRAGLREVDKRRGWRGPKARISEPAYMATFSKLQPVQGEVYPALVRSNNRGILRVLLGDKVVVVDVNESGWAKKFLSSDESVRFGSPADLLREGDLIEVSLRDSATSSQGGKQKGGFKVVLDQTPVIEGAVVLIDPITGLVRSMAGGYDYNQSQFNRVTQSLRQPGSTFKPVVYLAAIDKFKYTPSTIVHDSPRTFRVGDTFWEPGNFDGKFLGAITLRTALEKSRNLVSADIVSRIGVEAPIHYARLMGIKSPLGRNLSLSLGSGEVSVLELTRAYGVLAAKGVFVDSVFVTQIKDRFGRIIYDYEQERLVNAHKVLDENSAFVLTTMMKGVVDNGTGYKVKELGRPVAGKTGTSNDQMDAWFIGFTPQWVCGVWVGFDQKKQIGPKETGGVVSAPIWLNFMRDFLEHQKSQVGDDAEREAKAEAETIGIEYTDPVVNEQLDFSAPEGVEPFWVFKETGARAPEGASGAILEYFVKGTEPSEAASVAAEENDAGADSGSYFESPDL